jgi:hypothetical protein
MIILIIIQLNYHLFACYLNSPRANDDDDDDDNNNKKNIWKV